MVTRQTQLEQDVDHLVVDVHLADRYLLETYQEQDSSANRHEYYGHLNEWKDTLY